VLFSEVLATLVPAAAGGYTARIPDDWLQGRTGFGGILAALGNHAIRQLVPAAVPLRSLQVTWAGPSGGGEVGVTAEVLRQGRSTTVAEARIRSATELATVVVGVYGAPRTSQISISPDIVPARHDIEAVPELPVAPGLPGFFGHFAIRWAEGGVPFSGSTEPRTTIYLRHREPGRMTESHLVALGDVPPSPALSMLSRPARSSSITWLLEITAPDLDFDNSEWWCLDTEIIVGNDGYIHQAATLRDPRGRLAALSRQTHAIFG
jgi:acyl-CoA thioesterase